MAVGRSIRLTIWLTNIKNAEKEKQITVLATQAITVIFNFKAPTVLRTSTPAITAIWSRSLSSRRNNELVLSLELEKSIQAKWRPRIVKNKPMAEGGLRHYLDYIVHTILLCVQSTHYIIMLQNTVLFMALLQNPSPIFILCGKCLWCATYFDKRHPVSALSNQGNRRPRWCCQGDQSSNS